MCGLIGYFTSTWVDTDKNALIDLTLMSQVRGLDSTGIVRFSLADNKKGLYHDVDKEAVTASQFIYDRKYQLFQPEVKKSSIYGMLVHVRSATKGTVSDKNAHPFENKKIVGMHNGTIHGTFENSYKYDTDSEAIFHNIAEFGIQEGLKKVNAASKVAYALQFYDKDTGNVHFIRNGERTLYMAWEKKSDTYVVASEKVFIKYIEDKYGFNFDRVILLGENKLYTLEKLSGNGFGFSEKTLDVKPPPRVVYNNPTHGYNGGMMGNANFMNPTGSTSYIGGTPTTNTFVPFVPASSIKFPTNTFLRIREHSRVFTPPTGARPPSIQADTPSDGGTKAEDKGSEATVDDHQDCKISVVDQIEQKIETSEVKADTAPFLKLDRFSWDLVIQGVGGCMYCETHPDYSQRGKLLWISDDNFLCHVCKNSPTILGALTADEVASAKSIITGVNKNMFN